MLMNLVPTCLYHKVFFTVFFSDNYQNKVTLPHSAQIKHALFVRMKEKSKSQKQIPKKKVTLELEHHRLGLIYTRSLLYGRTSNF